MMQYRLFAIVVGAFVLAGGACRGGADPVWCIPGDAVQRAHAALPGAGLNPLLPNPPPMCFTRARDCMESQDGAAAPAACMKIARPSWHCYTLLGPPPNTEAERDPLDGAPTCFPSAALCNATRSDKPMAGGDVRWSPCTAVDAVACYTTNRAEVCTGTEDQCERSRSLERDMLTTEPKGELGPCVARRSRD